VRISPRFNQHPVLLELEKISLGRWPVPKVCEEYWSNQELYDFLFQPPSFFKVEVYSSLTHFGCDSKVKAGSRLVKMVRSVRENTHSYLVHRFGVDVVMYKQKEGSLLLKSDQKLRQTFKTDGIQNLILRSKTNEILSLPFDLQCRLFTVIGAPVCTSPIADETRTTR
jgi:hypothetical protein